MAFHVPRATDDPLRYHLPVEVGACVGPAERQFMMGGVGLGSAIEAIEHAAERPVVCATAQYLGFARAEQVVEIDVQIPVRGRNVTQARALSHVGENEIIAVSAALGRVGADDRDRQFAAMPEPPPPADCDVEPPMTPGVDNLHSWIDRRRVVDAKLEAAGRGQMWCRSTIDQPIGPGLLAVFADFLPGAISTTKGSTSLDNTLRVIALEDTEWILLDTSIHVHDQGLFHGEMRLFAESGRLLAIASQSGILPRIA